VLRSPEQTRFAAVGVKEIDGIIQGWFQDGMPLGLTIDMFKHILCLDPKANAEALFHVFDTDRNQKVDAFELLAASVLLARGTLEEKVEAMFPIFDLSGSGVLNFDEVNILLQSLTRGLTKVCRSQPVSDEQVIDACRRCFDAHNVRYDKQISREQIKRWVSNDVETMEFIDAYQNSCALPQAEVELENRLRSQREVLSRVGGGGSSLHEIFRSEAMRQALGSPSEEDLRSFAGALASAGGSAPVGQELFADGLKAWNAFDVADIQRAGKLPAPELRLLLLLWTGSEPSVEVVQQVREGMTLREGDLISRSAWVSSCLGGGPR
jgi:hypothetical protein